MKAWTADSFGEPGSLVLSDVPIPKVGPDSVLIRTRAVGLNPVDWKALAGGLDDAFDTLFPVIPCWDVAGVVEEVGAAVGTWSKGDEVVAYCRKDVFGPGTLAEFVSVPLRGVGPKPARASWAEAATVPLAGLTAYQGLHDHLQVRAGDTVLVLAATGGVGGFAVQLAYIAKARVLGSASDEHADYVGDLGGEFVSRGNDLVPAVRRSAPSGINCLFDLVGGDEARDAADLLVPGGTLMSIVDADGAQSLGGRYGFVRPDPSQLAELARLIDAGVLRVQLAESFSFDEAPAALELQKQGHVRGKLAIELISDSRS